MERSGALPERHIAVGDGRGRAVAGEGRPRHGEHGRLSKLVLVGLRFSHRRRCVAQMLPNGTHGIVHVNITRNYTYTVGKVADVEGRRPLLRYETTQSIPFHRDAKGNQHLLPPDAPNRDCWVMDYTEDRVSGAATVPPTAFAPPAGVGSCVPIGARAES